MDELKQGYVDVGNALVDAVHQLSNPVLDFLFEALTKLGEPVTLVPLAVCLTIFLPRQRWLGPSVLLAVLTVAVVNDELKETFKIERPFGATAVGESTPSAHAMTAAAAWFQIAVVAGGRWRRLCIAIPFVVSLSRVYLEQHYPFDVLMGLAFGAVVAYVWYSIFHPPSSERAVVVAHCLAGAALGGLMLYDRLE